MSIYNSHLEDLPVGLPDEEELTTSSWHLYAIRSEVVSPFLADNSIMSSTKRTLA